jgi:hypothetical protein
MKSHSSTKGSETNAVRTGHARRRAWPWFGICLLGCSAESGDTSASVDAELSEQCKKDSCALEIHVSPSGDDKTGTGQPSAPFASLAKAKQAVANGRKAAPSKGDIVVLVHGGDYEQLTPLEFNESDGGTADQKIIYRAVPGQKATIYGGKRLTGWKLVRDNLYQVSVPQLTDRTWSFNVLLENGKSATLARHPNRGYLTAAGGEGRRKLDARTADLKPEDIGPESQVSIWAGHDWFQNVIEVKTFDSATGKVELESDTSQNIAKEDRYFVQGAQANLDSKGEFYINRKQGTLTYWPRMLPIENQEIVGATTPVIISLKGSGANSQVKNLRFEGLHLQGGSFARNFREQGEVWNQPAPQNRLGLVTMENAAQIELVGNVVSGAGYSGIALTHGVQNVDIRLNHIYDVGYHGILAIGEDVGAVGADGNQVFDNKGHTIYGNHIHGVGNIVGHGAGIFLFQSGKNTITRNKIHDGPRYGVALKGSPQLEGMIGKTYGNTKVSAANYQTFHTGRNNVISGNEVYDVVADSDDAGAISVWGGGEGNVAKDNLIYDLFFKVAAGSGEGIYLDDGANDWTLDGNVVHTLKGKRVQGIFAKGIGSKLFRNIIVLDSPSDFGIRSQEFANVKVGKHVYRKNVIVFRKEGGHVFDFPNFDADRIAESNDNIFFAAKGGELSFRVADKELSVQEWRRLDGANRDVNSKVTDPKFTNLQGGDFSFGGDSPLSTLGLTPLNSKAIGLPEEYSLAR